MLLLQAKRLQETSARWPRELGHLLALQLESARPEEVTPLCNRVLEEFREASYLEQNPEDNSGLIHDLATCALVKGDRLKAEAYAIVLVKNPWEEYYFYPGNAIHHGNILRGHLAPMDEDVEAAERYLLASVRLPEGPEDRTVFMGVDFNTDRTLPKLLLERGRRDAVLTYFGLSRKVLGEGPSARVH